jgi:hypothetical protein
MVVIRRFFPVQTKQKVCHWKEMNLFARYFFSILAHGELVERWRPKGSAQPGPLPLGKGE